MPAGRLARQRLVQASSRLQRRTLDFALAYEQRRKDRSQHRRAASGQEYIVESRQEAIARRVRDDPACSGRQRRHHVMQPARRHGFDELATMPAHRGDKRDCLVGATGGEDRSPRRDPDGDADLAEVSSMPAAMPLRSFGTTLSATSAITVLTIPTPTPARMKPGRSAVQPSLALRPAIRTRPSPDRASPTPSCAHAAQEGCRRTCAEDRSSAKRDVR
jgi:hypothetical protein